MRLLLYEDPTGPGACGPAVWVTTRNTLETVKERSPGQPPGLFYFRPTPRGTPLTRRHQHTMSTVALMPDVTTDLRLDHLRALEAESIHIMREVVAEFEQPVMLY